jgi:hypothetical protein
MIELLIVLVPAVMVWVFGALLVVERIARRRR